MPAQQLVSVDDISPDNAPQIYVAGGLKPFIDHVREEVSGEVPDTETKKGRDRIASLAAKVSKSKVAVEKPGRDYLKKLKEMPKVVEEELREFVRAMDALRDETRKPLTEWENAEAARVADFQGRIQDLEDFAAISDELGSAGVQVQIDSLKAISITESWQEFEAEAHRVKAASLESLEKELVRRKAREAEQAELERLRAEQEAQAQREREAQLVREAEERARREAEQAAQAEREAVIRREAEAKAKVEAVEREREQAIKRAEQAEREAEAKAEAAAAAERQRYLDEQKELARQALERERDQANKAAVNRKALDAFIAGGMPEDCAKKAVVLIAKKQIPNITISY